MTSRTYTVVVTFTVGARTDEHLRTERAIRSEFRSWIEGLNASVQDITVTMEERTK